MPESLHVIQEILAAGVTQHVAQQAAQQPDVVPHRLGHLVPVEIPADRLAA